MPHFYAASLLPLKCPVQCGEVAFECEAVALGGGEFLGESSRESVGESRESGIEPSGESALESCVKSSPKPPRESLILARVRGESVLLLRQEKGENSGSDEKQGEGEKCGRILVKYNRNLALSDISLAKIALSAYAKLTHAKIISANLGEGFLGGESCESVRESRPKNAPNPPRRSKDSKDSRRQDSPPKDSLVSPDSHLLRFSDLAGFLADSKNAARKISIEIGFGSGRHLLDLALENQGEIFLGVEIYRPAIRQVLGQIRRLNLQNLFVIHADCRALFETLPPQFFSRVYLHFPIPWEKCPARRVFSEDFLRQTLRILRQGGFLELRTDSEIYFLDALEIAQRFATVRVETSQNEALKIKSKYEARWLRQEKDIFSARFFAGDFRESESALEPTPKSTPPQSTQKSPKKSPPNLAIATKIAPLNIAKILSEKSPKHRNLECFLHIKCVYAGESSHILFLVFGSFGAPARAYLWLKNSGECEILGEILPSVGNLEALKMLQKIYGEAQ